MTQGQVEAEEPLLDAPDVQRILIRLYKGENVEFKATIAENEEIGYVEFERIARVDSVRAKEMLDLLERQGILVKEPSESFYACPTCDSKKLAFRIRCPACKGEAFRSGSALEHLNCGHADLEEAFVTASGFGCPRCKKSLKALGVDYRRFSNYYQCVNCGRLSGIVDDLLACGRCGRKMLLEEARPGVLSTYRYNPESRGKVERRLSTLHEVERRLRARNYTSRIDGFVKGNSGIEHHFDLVAWAGDDEAKGRKPEIVAEVVIGDRGSIDGRVSASLAKALDVGGRHTILVVVPQTMPEWVKMAAFYGITILECPDISGVASVVESAVMDVVESPSRRETEHPLIEEKPEPGVPSHRSELTAEDNIILRAISEKQDELSRLMRWFLVKSDRPQSQGAALRTTRDPDR